jgi:hypothetical protein
LDKNPRPHQNRASEVLPCFKTHFLQAQPRELFAYNVFVVFLASVLICLNNSLVRIEASGVWIQRTFRKFPTMSIASRYLMVSYPTKPVILKPESEKSSQNRLISGQNRRIFRAYLQALLTLAPAGQCAWHFFIPSILINSGPIGTASHRTGI